MKKYCGRCGKQLVKDGGIKELDLGYHTKTGKKKRPMVYQDWICPFFLDKKEERKWYKKGQLFPFGYGHDREQESLDCGDINSED